MIKRALARKFGIDCGLIRPRADETTPNEIEVTMSGEDMWTPDAFDRLVRKYPEGGTFYSKSKGTIRCLRTIHLQPGVVLAFMFEKPKGAPRRDYLFVKNGEQIKVNPLSPTNLEQESILEVLFILTPDDIEKVGKFIYDEALRM